MGRHGFLLKHGALTSFKYHDHIIASILFVMSCRQHGLSILIFFLFGGDLRSMLEPLGSIPPVGLFLLFFSWPPEALGNRILFPYFGDVSHTWYLRSRLP